MSKYDELDPGLLYQYFKGDASPQVVDAVHLWVAEDDRRAQVLDDLQKTLDVVQRRARARVSVQDRVEAAAVLHAECSMHQDPFHESGGRWRDVEYGQAVGSPRESSWSGAFTRRNTKFAYLLGLGACVALILGQLPVVRNIEWTGAAEPTSVDYVTARAQQATIELVDGTIVELNVASRLTVAGHRRSPAQESQRLLNLSGQAAFTVVHNQRLPLIVQAGETRATVLGTRFAIEAYTHNVRIAVESGKLSVDVCDNNGTSSESVPSLQPGCAHHTASTVLGQNDVAIFDPSGKVARIPGADVESEFGFTAGRLILADSSLVSIVAHLNRWYNIDIRIGDENIGNRVLAGTFTGESPDAFIKAMSVLLNARVERQGRVITVYSKTEPLTKDTL